MKRKGELCQPLAEYRHKKVNHLLPTTPRFSSNQVTVPVESASDISLLSSNVGCTPPTDAIHLDDACKLKRKRLINCIKQEGECLLQSTSPLSMTINSDNTATVIPSTLVTPVSAVSNKDEVKRSLSAAGKENNNNNEVVTTKQTTPLPVVSNSCLRRRDPSVPRSVESLDVLKLKQAQRKEEWRKKHKEKSEKDGESEDNGDKFMADIGGGDALITDGMSYV